MVSLVRGLGDPEWLMGAFNSDIWAPAHLGFILGVGIWGIVDCHYVRLPSEGGTFPIKQSVGDKSGFGLRL